MDNIPEIKRKQFNEILDLKKITTVYQPIVSLKDGNILGFEALSRITLEECTFNIEEAFQLAEKLEKVWELEALCRIQSLKNAICMPKNKKLLINVDPQVIHDKQFRSGMTCEFLQKYGLMPEDIVFEITERTSVEDKEAFQGTIEHYKMQHFQIAIDDFGNGYAGLNRVCNLSPEYLKIDMNVIRGIDTDKLRQSLVESFVHFCASSHIFLIAEGIETETELETLIRLGVTYGQGYFLQRPVANMYDLDGKIKNTIRNIYMRYHKFSYQPSFFGKIGTIARNAKVVELTDHVQVIYEYLSKNPEITEVCVVDAENRAVGLLTRSYISFLMGGRFGYNLNSKKYVGNIVNSNAMIVDEAVAIETVSKMALARSVENLYDTVIVTKEEKYVGIVTVKDLLETAITIQVSKAIDASPLTGLPGNTRIQEEIKKAILEHDEYAIIYFDMDNFKAYNDAYGFQNGDLMIKNLAGCIQEAAGSERFVGHIGGDDFVMITYDYEIQEICAIIIQRFTQTIQSLYNEEDWERGFIISRNRSGFVDKFPIATISIAALSNKNRKFNSVETFSKELAGAKKAAKHIKGNSVICI